jgi:Tfp pilus assembly protein PilV
MTLVEVMIALVVVGLLLSISLLRGGTLSSRYQLAIATEQLAADLQRARLEAIRLNAPVTFQRTSLTQYQIPGVVTRTLAGGIAFDNLAPASVQFSSLGRLVGAPSAFLLQHGTEARQVSVAAGGALTIQ